MQNFECKFVWPGHQQKTMLMKYLLPCFLFIFANTAFSQIKSAYFPQDSVDFPKEYNYKQWRMDTIHIVGLEARINSLVVLHRNHLPKYRRLQKAVKEKLDQKTKDELAVLEGIYMGELIKYRRIYLGGKKGFNEELPIFSHLNFVVIFETLSFYPDVYRVLINNAFVVYNADKTSSKNRESASEMIDLIYERTQKRLKPLFDDRFKSFLEGLASVEKSSGVSLPWGGSISPESREQYDWVSFLLWCNRSK
jgi:hypothetical protein